MKCKLTVLTIFLVSLSAFSQSKQEFSVEELKEDFLIMKGSLEEFHPGLYWYRSKQEIDSAFEVAAAKLNHPMDEYEYLRVLGSVISKIGCGHTDVSFSSDKWDYKTAKYLPIKMWFDDDRAYFVEYGGTQEVNILPGNQIISINDIGIDSLINHTLQLLTGDGFGNSGKYDELNSYFYYLLTYYFGASESYNVAFIDSIGQKRSIKVQGLTFDQIQFVGQSENSENLSLEIQDNEEIAVMTIRHWFDWREDGKKVKINDRMQSAFEQLVENDIESLIIDLRQNGGGKEPWRLFAYLHDEPFIFARSAEYKYSKNSVFSPYQRLSPPMKWIKRNRMNQILPGSNKSKKVNDSTFLLTNLYMVKPFKPLQPRYKGRVVILIDGGSFSATSLLAAKIKSEGNAILVGQETGGSYYGNTAMSPTVVTLPNSNLEVKIPLVKYELDVKPILPLGSGVVPDHIVNNTIDDIINGNDPQMEFVLKLLKETSP